MNYKKYLQNLMSIVIIIRQRTRSSRPPVKHAQNVINLCRKEVLPMMIEFVVNRQELIILLAFILLTIRKKRLRNKSKPS